MSGEWTLIQQSDERKTAQRFLYPLLCTGTIILLAVSHLSVLGAYYWFSCDEWRSIFAQSDDPGLAVFKEIGRSTIFLSLTAFLLYRWFPVETARFLDFRFHDLRADAFRIAFLLLALVLGVQEFNRHWNLDNGPMDFAETWRSQAEAAGETDTDSLPPLKVIAQRVAPAYRSYLPYSLINYLGIGTPLLVLTFYAFFAELPDINLLRRTTEQHLQNSPDETAALLDDFRAYREECRRRSERYMNVVFAITLHMTYELTFGGSTLSPEAWTLLMCFWIVVLTTVICPIYVVNSYYETTEVFRDELLRRKALSADFNEMWSVSTFSSQLARHTYVGAVSGFVLNIVRRP